MTSELTTIKNAYEQENMTPEQIAECQALDIAAVKAGLMQCSSKYRKDCGQEDEAEDTLNFNNDDLRRMNDVIRDIALSSDDDNLRFKAATYIRNDKKGRLEPARVLAGQNFNILFINEQLKKVRSVADGIKNNVLNRPKEIVNV